MGELQLRLTPRSSRNELKVGEAGVKAWVTAPPVDGEANAALIELVAKSLGIAKGAVLIVSGETAREKTLRIEGLTDAELLARLGANDSGPRKRP